MTPLELLAAAGVTALGATVQGSIGFGLALVSVPLLFLIDPRLVPGPFLCVALILTLLISHREREHIVVHDVAWAVAGRVPGAALGATALVLLSADVLSLLFGVLVLLAVALSSFKLRVQLNRWSLIGAGLLSGFMGTTAAIGGPPMALLLQNLRGPRLRGTLSGFFVVGVFVSLLALAVVGRLGREELGLALAILPGIVLGFLISRYTARVLDRGYTRVAILVVASVAAIVAIGRQIL